MNTKAISLSSALYSVFTFHILRILLFIGLNHILVSLWKTKIGYLSSYSTPHLDRRYIFWASCSANSRERIEIILRKTAYCFRPDLVKSQAYFNIVPTGNVIIIRAIRKVRILVGIKCRVHDQFAYAEHLLTRHIYIHACRCTRHKTTP